MANVSYMFQVVRNKVTETGGRVVGYKLVKGKKKKASAWWTSEVKDVVEKKKKSYDRLTEKKIYLCK